jgi:EpsI family protein
LVVTGTLSVAMMPQRLMADSKHLPALESLIPHRFGDWRHDDLTDKLLIKPRMKAAPDPHDQALARTYINGQGERVMLFVSYGSNQLGHEFQEHRPEFCYRAAGFTLLETSDARLSLSAQDLKVRQLLAQQNERLEAITYWMTIGDLPTLPGVPRKIEQLRHGLRGEIPDGMLVRVSSLKMAGTDAFGLQARFIADLQRAVPDGFGFRPVPATPAD